jgi:hypothetical protein
MPMDRAYEGNETRQLGLDPGVIPAVPPTSKPPASMALRSRRFGKRNEIECLFRRLKGFRRSFSTV